MTSNQRTELSALGEFGLIHHLTQNIKLKNGETLQGVGDDCAVIRQNGLLTLITTDMLVEGVHFDLTYHPLKHLGYKAAVVNFSDILAMNGTPRHMVVSMAVSNRFPLEALEEIYNGLLLACERYGVDLVGGDTVSSLQGLVLSITVTGEVAEEDVVYRNTAKEGDLICVTGNLGAAYMGLLLLEREKKVYQADPDMQPDLEGFDYILERQLKPEIKPELKTLLKEKDVRPTAMIDISDGLASEVLHLCNGSGLGSCLYEEKIPLHEMTETMAAQFQFDPTTAALNGGEDYELLFTIRPADYEKIKDIEWITPIGHMTDPSTDCVLIARSGQTLPLNAQGWDAFRNPENQ